MLQEHFPANLGDYGPKRNGLVVISPDNFLLGDRERDGNRAKSQPRFMAPARVLASALGKSTWCTLMPLPPLPGLPKKPAQYFSGSRCLISVTTRLRNMSGATSKARR